jgi:hypothetical protein
MGTGLEVNAAGGIEANAFATGAKKYGANRGTTATSGPVSKIGYLARSRKQAARKKAIAAMIAKKAN